MKFGGAGFVNCMHLVEVQLHAFLISALDGGEWSFSRSRRSTPWKNLQYTLNRRLGGPLIRYGHGREEKNCVPLPRIEMNPTYIFIIKLFKSEFMTVYFSELVV
jgi:hypothetical protein